MKLKKYLIGTVLAMDNDYQNEDNVIAMFAITKIGHLVMGFSPSPKRSIGDIIVSFNKKNDEINFAFARISNTKISKKFDLEISREIKEYLVDCMNEFTLEFYNTSVYDVDTSKEAKHES